MRQNSIITLTDHNKEEIEKIKMQKEEVLKDFEARKLGTAPHTYLVFNSINF